MKSHKLMALQSFWGLFQYFSSFSPMAWIMENELCKKNDCIIFKWAFHVRACAHLEVHYECKLIANMSSTSYFHLQLKWTRLEKNLCTHVWCSKVQMSVLTTVVCKFCRWRESHCNNDNNIINNTTTTTKKNTGAAKIFDIQECENNN